VKLTPEGSAPVSVRAGAGYPRALIEKLPALLAEKVAVLALVILGASSTVKVKAWLVEPTELVAVSVRA
jgi:hypothetical protein